MKTNSKTVHNCHDCGLEIREQGTIYKIVTPEVTFYKCESCFKSSSTSHQKCEVYSRVVGYMRPVENWNPGKAEEYKDRKEFKPKVEEYKNKLKKCL